MFEKKTFQATGPPSLLWYKPTGLLLVWGPLEKINCENRMQFYSWNHDTKRRLGCGSISSLLLVWQWQIIRHVFVVNGSFLSFLWDLEESVCLAVWICQDMDSKERLQIKWHAIEKLDNDLDRKSVTYNDRATIPDRLFSSGWHFVVILEKRGEKIIWSVDT